MKSYSLQEIINYLENTTEESWCMDVCRKGEQNCLFGHLFEMGGNNLCEFFEEFYATTFMFFQINDGEHSKYKQTTPKQRIIAYLCDLRDGKEKTTQDYYREYEL